MSMTNTLASMGEIGCVHAHSDCQFHVSHRIHQSFFANIGFAAGEIRFCMLTPPITQLIITDIHVRKYLLHFDKTMFSVIVECTKTTPEKVQSQRRNPTRCPDVMLEITSRWWGYNSTYYSYLSHAMMFLISSARWLICGPKPGPQMQQR